ncbi:MAG: iron ABC transporter permease [Clostridiales bacterium]|nr:iron ABC transporter permease [Clostridiales bacterium]
MVKVLARIHRPGPPWFLLLPALLVLFLSLVPLGYVIFRTLELPAHEIQQLLLRPRTMELVKTTLALMVAVTGLSLLIGVASAWVVERTDLPRKDLWRGLLPLPFVVPSFVSSYSWLSLFPGVEQFWGAVLILTLYSYPLIFLPASASLRQMDPALEEVARSLGLGPREVFRRVTLPHLRPAMLGGALLVALHMLAEFGALSLLRVDTLTTAIFLQYELAFNNSAAALYTALLLLICLGVLLLERLFRGTALYFPVGPGARRDLMTLPLGKARGGVGLALSLLLIAGVGLPVVTVIYWLLKGASAGRGLQAALPAAFTSLGLAAVGATLAVAVALPVVILARRYGSPLALWAEKLAFGLRAVPGLVIALALVFAAIRWAYPLYQTLPLLWAGYLLLFLPLALAPIGAALEQAPPRLEEAARTLGKGPGQAFWAVTAPLLVSGLGAGWILVFLGILAELTLTLVLVPTGYSTLAMEIWSHTSRAEYAAAAPFALLLLLLAAVPAAWVMRQRAAGQKVWWA